MEVPFWGSAVVVASTLLLGLDMKTYMQAEPPVEASVPVPATTTEAASLAPEATSVTHPR